MNSIQGLSKRVLLCILDGFGHNPQDLKNAVLHAKKPTLDDLFAHYPFTTIQPGGEAVGLPKGVAGNSEVGHMNLGAGRPVRQDLVRINEAVANDSLKDMPRWKELLEKARKAGRLHLLTLLSDGGVHSHIDHLKHVLGLLKQEKGVKVFLHAFMDGRDTPKDKGLHYLRDILSVGGFTLASLQGRSIGMDRDRRWEKIQSAMAVMSGGEGIMDKSPEAYVQDEYASGRFDEFILPALFSTEGAIRAGDPLFFLNFRPDRARQITLAWNDPGFKEFPVHARPGYWLCMSPYVPDELPGLPVLFDKEKVKGTLAQYLGESGRKQFKIAETEKYAHVTYFFNGGEEKPFPGEERVLIPSPREVATYDLKPEMSAPAVCEMLCEKLSDESFTFYAVNFANPDMVGHSGKYEATVKAIEALDECIARLVVKCAQEDVTLVITADHGNADQMVYPDGSPHTSHSEAEVPFCVVHPKLRDQKVPLNPDCKTPALKDVAPTVLTILGMPMPTSFTGKAVFL